MSGWNSEREELLGYVARYAEWVSDEGAGSYAECVRQNEEALDVLLDELSAYAAKPPDQLDTLDATDVIGSLTKLRAAAAAGDNETTKDVVCELRTTFPMNEYPSPELFEYLAALTDGGAEDTGEVR